MSTIIQLDMPDELLGRLDSLARERFEAEAPLPIGRWIKEHPDGRECFQQLSSQPRWLRCPTEEYQAFVKESYRKSVGGRPSGRPPLSRYRLEVIVEALEAYLSPRAMETAKQRRA